MSFNLGVSNHPISRLGGLSSVGVYLYEDVYYRQWITEIALAFYEGRQDEFVWLDLVRQFRNPEKQQILPCNFTKEIIDETSILYKEDPVYQVVDESGKIIAKDQKLWEEIQEKSRYKMTMDKVDRWAKLLGTPLVKVGIVDPNSGYAVKKTEPGQIQLDVLHGGVYDTRYGASPYYITELLIGFNKSFGGFNENNAGGPDVGVNQNLGMPGISQGDILYRANKVAYNQLGSINKVYWSPISHKMENERGDYYEVENPYGCIPGVPFFNQDPAHYYFLPINEPLIYANHAINMRLTDLNHIAKFQSFGVPVVKGVERPKSVRQGRPVDDFGQLKGGFAQSRFGGVAGTSGFAAGGQFRTFDVGFGLSRDGNADAAALGFTVGPDTAIAVGDKGDFKFAHPNADIGGLVNTIQAMSDLIRISHGLRPRYSDTLPPSAFALWTEKQGVIDENAGRRGKLFAEREAQLFQVIKSVWNTHHRKAGDKRFSPNSRLIVTYQQPKFPLDPKTHMEKEAMEIKILQTGDRQAYKSLYPHLPDAEINRRIKQRRKDKEEQALADADIKIKVAKKFTEAGIVQAQESSTIKSGSMATSSSSSESIQSPGAGGSPAGVQNTDNKLKQSQEKSKQYKDENQQKPTKENK